MGTRHWTQSYADIPAEIDADRFASMVDLLDAALERHASRPAFKAFGQTLSYADLDRLSRDVRRPTCRGSAGREARAIALR
jgi:long-chain acyl-CoA synthetase